MSEGLIPGEMLDPFTILALLDKDVKITDVGLDGIVIEVPGLGKVLIWACFNCTGEDSHLNFASVEDGSDAGAA